MSDENDFPIGDLVLYKNNQLIAFNKPSGLAVQHDREEEKTLHALGEIYTKSKLFIIHRLDQPATGVILFAKTPNALVSLNEQFRSRQTAKTYLALVGEMPPEPEATIIHYLRKDGKKNKSYAADKPAPGTKRAELSYKYLASSDRYHLLRVQLHTGRHHQIRAQLSAIGCPIKGDVKYGFRRSNRDRSIHLHAWKLSFSHPVSRDSVELVADPPAGDPVWEAFRDKLK
jgi:23S rRNA pseudouridine1911/1915/1917 synthase